MSQTTTPQTDSPSKVPRVLPPWLRSPAAPSSEGTTTATPARQPARQAQPSPEKPLSPSQKQAHDQPQNQPQEQPHDQPQAQQVQVQEPQPVVEPAQQEPEEHAAPQIPISVNMRALQNIAKSLPIAFSRVIVFDFETTGFTRDDTIIEIGAVEFVNGQLTGLQFHSFVDTPRVIHPMATKVHGITSKFLKGHPPITHVLPNFLNFISSVGCSAYRVPESPTYAFLAPIRDPAHQVALVAHNSQFDLRMLKQELARLNIAAPDVLNHVFCTKICFSKVFPNEQATLDNACHKFKISTTMRELHGAILDARLTAQLFVALSKHLLQFADSSLQIVTPQTTLSVTVDESSPAPAPALDQHTANDDLTATNNTTNNNNTNNNNTTNNNTTNNNTTNNNTTNNTISDGELIANTVTAPTTASGQDDNIPPNQAPPKQRPVGRDVSCLAPDQQEHILRFFQEASVEQVAVLPSCSVEEAQLVVGLGPFTSFDHLCDRLASTPLGASTRLLFKVQFPRH